MFSRSRVSSRGSRSIEENLTTTERRERAIPVFGGGAYPSESTLRVRNEALLPPKVDERLASISHNADGDDDSAPKLQLGTLISTTAETHEVASVWKKCAEDVWKSEQDMVANWKEDLDNLLVFDGLFSAIVTAFIVATYPELTPTVPDQTPYILMQISAQLDSFAISAGYANSTQPAFPPTLAQPSSPPVPRHIVAFNALWLLSLVLTLAAASISISVKQWLHHHVKPEGLSSPDRQVRIWNDRHNALISWRVEFIIGFLPVLLQGALLFFFLGLAILLQTLDSTVLSIAMVPTALLFLFAVVTAILPTIDPTCPYKSQPASAISWLFGVDIHGRNSSDLTSLPASIVAEILLAVYKRLRSDTFYESTLRPIMASLGLWDAQTVFDTFWEFTESDQSIESWAGLSSIAVDLLNRSSHIEVWCDASKLVDAIKRYMENTTTLAPGFSTRLVNCFLNSKVQPSALSALCSLSLSTVFKQQWEASPADDPVDLVLLINRTMDMLTDNLAGVDPDEQMHIVRLVFHLLDYMPDSVEPIYHRFFVALENPAISPSARLLLLRLMAVAGGRFSFEPGELDWCSVISESFYDCITQAQDLHLCSWLVRSLADLSLRVSLQETTQRRIQEVCSDLRRYLEGTTQLLYKPPEIKEYYWCQWSYYTGFQHSGSSMTRHSPERTLMMAKGAVEDLIRFFQQNEAQETGMRPRSGTIRSL